MPLDKRYLDACHEWSRLSVQRDNLFALWQDAPNDQALEAEYRQVNKVCCKAAGDLCQIRNELAKISGKHPPILAWRRSELVGEELVYILAEHPMVEVDHRKVPCDLDGVPLAQGATP